MSNKFLLNLKKKIKSKSLTVGVVGLGYVGLPLVIRFSEVGFKVIGFEIDKKKITALNKGISFISHIDSKKIKKAKRKQFFATNDFSLISKTDVIIICVPTPINKNKKPDLSFIKDSLRKCRNYFCQGQLLCLESTTYPGTTEEIIVTAIKNLNLQVGKDFFVSYSPEREDPGNKSFSTKKIPKLVSGHTKNCTKISSILYSSIIDQIVTMSSPRIAEFTKLLENIHRSVNIGLMNEMKLVAQKLNINIYEAIEAASTKPFGFTPYQPGPGVGGHCIPVDPYYLSWTAKRYKAKTQLLDIATQINDRMPKIIFKKTLDFINKKNLSYKNLKVLIIGVAYKKNIDDLRESPSLEIMKLFESKKVSTDYIDPYVPKIFLKNTKKNKTLYSINMRDIPAKKYDLALILTAHDNVRHEKLSRHIKYIIDTRNSIDFKSENVIDL
tara:strand:- start:1199 stop:2518 length:1320 start_codon:yes stop_codon:yes gene_type:complete